MLVTTIPRTLNSCHESLGHEQMYHYNCHDAATLDDVSKHFAKRRQHLVDDKTMCAFRGLSALSLREGAG